MAYRYLTPLDKEDEASFRVVEIMVVAKKPAASGKNIRKFLLIDNRREILEIVQKDMEDFVKNAVMANRITMRDQARFTAVGEES